MKVVNPLCIIITVAFFLTSCGPANIGLRIVNLEEGLADLKTENEIPQRTIEQKHQTPIEVTFFATTNAGCILTQTTDASKSEEFGPFHGSFFKLKDSENEEYLSVMIKKEESVGGLYLKNFSNTFQILLNNKLSEIFQNVNVKVNTVETPELLPTSSITLFAGHSNIHHIKRTQVSLYAILENGEPLIAEGSGEYHLSNGYRIFVIPVILTLPIGPFVAAAIATSVNDNCFRTSIIYGLNSAAEQLAKKIEDYVAQHPKQSPMKWRITAVLGNKSDALSEKLASGQKM